ncbi:MAG: EAL domain-containing protein [Actinobacteria bacterium]|nr:EAL domain-containing protein [Actinomycetota bacterium]
MWEEVHGGQATKVRERDAAPAASSRWHVHCLYQPVVDLYTSAGVGYEALARGLPGSPLATPDRLFAAARAEGQLVELDWACRGAALQGALDGRLDTHALFVNVEPEALGTESPPELTELWESSSRRLNTTLEITERALTARPAEMLYAVERLREQGWHFALDDVGADPSSLALLPLLQPDVIKLDLRLVQEQPSSEVAAIMNAVNAERERSGALILAEGIETEAHRATALALGATLGQGWLFGRPEELPTTLPPPQYMLRPRNARRPMAGTTPFEVVSPVRLVRRGDKRLLIGVSKHLEQQAAKLGATAVIVSAFQSVGRFTPLTRGRYAALAGQAAFVAALGVGIGEEPAPGVRGAALEPDDSLLGEWSVVVLGPHFAAALVARDLDDTGSELDRRFDFALTYERELVIQAAAALMQRVAPLEPLAP